MIYVTLLQYYSTLYIMLYLRYFISVIPPTMINIVSVVSFSKKGRGLTGNLVVSIMVWQLIQIIKIWMITVQRMMIPDTVTFIFNYYYIFLPKPHKVYCWVFIIFDRGGFPYYDDIKISESMYHHMECIIFF